MGKLLRFPQPQAGLHRYAHLCGGKNLLQEAVQLRRLPQKARPFSFGRHGAGGTAEIQIDLPVTHLLQLARRPQEVLRAPRQELRHGVQPLVVLRRNLPQIFFCENMVVAGGQKRHEVFVRLFKIAAVGLSVKIAGHALHRGGIIAHGGSPFIRWSWALARGLPGVAPDYTTPTQSFPYPVASPVRCLI